MNKTINILVADDQRTNRLLVKSCLSSLVHKVRFTLAKNGLEAIKYLEKESFDLVVTDYQMPEEDGSAVLACAKKAGIPAILISADNVWEIADEHGSPFILKPFEDNELIEIASKALQRQSFTQTSEGKRQPQLLRRVQQALSSIIDRRN
ncbi:MAG: response regulator [Candidatus Thiodiazotropha endolucinida]